MARQGLVNLDLDLVRAFVAVVETGSATRAAERLGRTQPAVSMQLQRLQERLGVVLLAPARPGRNLRLTPDGERILPAARRLLQANDDIVAGVAADDLEGEIRLGAPEEFAALHLTPILADFARSHPKVAVSVVCDLSVQLLEQFRAGALDLVLVKRDPLAPVDGAVAWREPLVWVGAGPIAPGPREPVSLCVRPAPCLLRKRGLTALEDSGRQARIAYTSLSLVGLHAAVRAGMGVSILPLETVPEDMSILSNDLLPPLGEVELVLMKARTGLPQAAEVLSGSILEALRSQAISRARAA